MESIKTIRALNITSVCISVIVFFAQAIISILWMGIMFIDVFADPSLELGEFLGVELMAIILLLLPLVYAILNVIELAYSIIIDKRNKASTGNIVFFMTSSIFQVLLDVLSITLSFVVFVIFIVQAIANKEPEAFIGLTLFFPSFVHGLVNIVLSIICLRLSAKEKEKVSKSV